MVNGLIVQPQVVQTRLRQTMDKCGLERKVADAVVASIPETQSFLRVVEIPDMRADEVSEAVQWEVAQHIPFGLENVYLDWQYPVGAGHKPVKGRQEVQVGAAQKKVVDGLYSTLKAFDLDIAAFELESQAIARCLISEELRGKQGLLLVDLGASATNVVIHDHGAVRFTASLRKGAADVAARLTEAEGKVLEARLLKLKKREETRLAAKLMPALEELTVEIKGVVEFYNSIDVQHEVKDIILTGGGSNLPGLEQAFLKYFENVNVQRGNPWVNLISGQRKVTPPMNLKESVRYATALGLALRRVFV